mmetsp:Transcript_63642/g.112792  ORF Transcript_63642/g.112792 Transcript_63642/m.112792 type:complete len:86 (+) Transcript_63642:753-1010(+)
METYMGPLLSARDKGSSKAQALEGSIWNLAEVQSSSTSRSPGLFLNLFIHFGRPSLRWCIRSISHYTSYSSIINPTKLNQSTTTM